MRRALMPDAGPAAVERPHALVAGWFSFEDGHATAGDLEVADVVCDALASLGISYDIATVPPFGSFDWQASDPRRYSHVIFACGPFGRAGMELETAFLRYFHSNLRIGVNLSMLVPVNEWNPFHLLLERDSSSNTRADLSFAAHPPRVPVVGVCLREPISGQLVAQANAAVERLVASREMAVVPIDTRLDRNSLGWHTPAEVESVISRLDALITTRLHGTVFALKAAVPVIAIDPQPGGGKITLQAQHIGWPLVFPADGVSDQQLREALAYCMSDDGRRSAAECRDRAQGLVKAAVDELRQAFQLTLGDGDGRFAGPFTRNPDGPRIIDAGRRGPRWRIAVASARRRLGRVLARLK